MVVGVRRRLCLEEGSRRGVRPQRPEGALLHVAAAGFLLISISLEGGKGHREESPGADIADADAAQGLLRNPSGHERSMFIDWDMTDYRLYLIVYPSSTSLSYHCHYSLVLY